MKFKESLDRVLQNKNANTLIENFISLSLLKVISFVFPLITMPYLSRVIGVDKFGAIAFASAIMVFVETVTDFGFNYTATRDVAQHRNDKEYISQYFSNVLWAKVVLMICSFIVFAVITYNVPFLYDERMLLFLTFLYIPGHILFPEWFFQAMEQMKYITIMNIGAKFLFILLVFVVIKQKEDYIYQPLLTAIGYLVSGILSMYIIIKKFGVEIKKPDMSGIYVTIKKGWNMFLCLIFPNLYSSLSVVLLRSFCGDTATGIYSSGQKFISISDQLAQVISRTFYPFLAIHIDKHKLFARINFIISITASICLFIFADLIIDIFYTSEFVNSATVIRIMSPGPFFLFLMNAYGNNYLVLRGYEYLLRNIIICSSVLGLMLSLFLVSRYSYIGISITLVVIWAIRGIITWIYANKIKNVAL